MGGAESALEDLQGRQRQMLLDVRLLLQELVDKIESGFTWLDTSNEHERQFRQLTDDSIQKIVHLLNNASDLDDQFAPVLEALYAGKRKNSVELF
jgi:hypothetical protein